MKNVEKRDSLRQSVNLPANIKPSNPAQILDISENGFGAVTNQNLGITSGEVTIPLSKDENVKTGFAVKWSHTKDNKQTRYGAEFTNLNADMKLNIRKLIIEKSIKETLDKIKDVALKNKLIGFWFKDFISYWQDWDDLKREMRRGELNQDLVQKSEKLNRGILEKAENLTEEIKDKEIIRSIREIFRFLTGVFFYKSSFFEKSLKKPRGYPGDFEMMEIIYNNSTASNDIIGQYADKFYLDNPYAEAVRNRKDKMVEILQAIFSETKSASLDVLNIACGPCREIKDLLGRKQNLNCKINYMCLDHDQEALDFAKTALNGALAKDNNFNIKFLKEDVLNLIRRSDSHENRLGKFDLIYSIGLADYLPDRLLKRMIQFSYNSLKPKGTFIIAHKIKKNDPYAPVTPKWICDWVFNARNVEDLIGLIDSSGIKGHSKDAFIWDNSQRIIFIPIKRN